MSARGYDSSYSLSPHVDLATLPLPDPRSAITITDDAITLTAGALDIGGFGKGYLIDLLAQDLKAHDLHHFLINGGGDIYVTSNQGQPSPLCLNSQLIIPSHSEKSLSMSKVLPPQAPLSVSGRTTHKPIRT